MSDDNLDYPQLVQAALLGVVRRALQVTAERGLPGEHHFYLTFGTDAPGVRIPPRLRKRYPKEMTVVLQHQFFELAVDETGFGVSLKFGGSLERIEVPFGALIAFTDPSVPFGLQFGRGDERKPDPEPEAVTSEGAPEDGSAKVVQFRPHREPDQ